MLTHSRPAIVPISPAFSFCLPLHHVLPEPLAMTCILPSLNQRGDMHYV